jgi:hypothetical protein
MAILQTYLIVQDFIHSPRAVDCISFIRDINSLVALMLERSAVTGNKSGVVFVCTFRSTSDMNISLPYHV